MPALHGLTLELRDPLVRRRLGAVAARLGLREGAPAAGLVVELELDGALELIARSRAESSELVIVGFLSTPDAERWTAAEHAGADLVTTRGRVDREAERLLAEALSGARRARRVRLAAERDFAGRLGFVGRIEDTPAGPIAIYQVGGRLHAIADLCPHAGATLSEGELEGEVLTCPRHGSQFRVSDGARVRGPADCEVRSVRVLVEAGEVFLEL